MGNHHSVYFDVFRIFDKLPFVNVRNDEYYMEQALLEAKKAASAGDVPVGAVAVIGGKVIARGHNRIEQDCDAAAHAEMLVLRETCNQLNRWRLDDVTIYVTIEPCPMCAMAMVLHRIKRVVFAASEPRTGAAGSFVNLLRNPELNHMVEITSGVCRDRAVELIKCFFRTRRES